MNKNARCSECGCVIDESLPGHGHRLNPPCDQFTFDVNPEVIDFIKARPGSTAEQLAREWVERVVARQQARSPDKNQAAPPQVRPILHVSPLVELAPRIVLYWRALQHKHPADSVAVLRARKNGSYVLNFHPREEVLAHCEGADFAQVQLLLSTPAWEASPQMQKNTCLWGVCVYHASDGQLRVSVSRLTVDTPPAAGTS